MRVWSKRNRQREVRREREKGYLKREVGIRAIRRDKESDVNRANQRQRRGQNGTIKDEDVWASFNKALIARATRKKEVIPANLKEGVKRGGDV